MLSPDRNCRLAFCSLKEFWPLFVQICSVFFLLVFRKKQGVGVKLCRKYTPVSTENESNELLIYLIDETWGTNCEKYRYVIIISNLSPQFRKIQAGFFGREKMYLQNIKTQSKNHSISCCLSISDSY